MKEFLASLLAITVIIGVLSAIRHGLQNQFISDILSEVIREVPKVIYFYGGNASGVMLAIFASSLGQQEADSSLLAFSLGLAILSAFVSFIYGCSLGWYLRDKEIYM